MLVAPNTQLCLLRQASLAGRQASDATPCLDRGGGGGERVVWSLCEVGKSATHASIDAAGTFHAGSTLGHVTALATLPPREMRAANGWEGEEGEAYIVQTQPLVFEVARVAAIHLLVVDEVGEGGPHFNGELSPHTATRLCATPVDVWGRPFFGAGLARGWLQLHVSPVDAVTIVTDESNKSCFTLKALDGWAAAMGQPAALLEVSMNLADPLEPPARAYAPLLVAELNKSVTPTTLSSLPLEGEQSDRLLILMSLLLALVVGAPFICCRRTPVVYVNPRSNVELSGPNSPQHQMPPRSR
ncbi:MAG: hypothetical protein SGPRY_003001 [Prymnesium sp.]